MAGTTDKYRSPQGYHLVYSALTAAAQKRSTITHEDVAECMGITPVGSYMAAETGAMLGVISEDECDDGRPLLSAFAVSSVSGISGEGFLGWAKDLGGLRDESKEGKTRFGRRRRRPFMKLGRSDSAVIV